MSKKVGAFCDSGIGKTVKGTVGQPDEFCEARVPCVIQQRVGGDFAFS